MTDRWKLNSKLSILCIMLSLTSAAWGQGNVGSLPTGNEKIELVSGGIGYQSILDTYLTPNRYTGLQLSIFGNTITYATTKNGRDCYPVTFSRVTLGTLTNKPGNGREFSAMEYIVSSNQFKWYESEQITLMAGASAHISGGAIYNMRNTNNPYQAKFDAGIGVCATGIFRFKLQDNPMALNAIVDLPLLGAGFYPEYGQLYYEMRTLKQIGKAFHLSWPGNTRQVAYGLSLDIPAGKNQVSVGYCGNLYSYNVNSLRCSIWDSNLTIGVKSKLELKYFGK